MIVLRLLARITTKIAFYLIAFIWANVSTVLYFETETDLVLSVRSLWSGCCSNAQQLWFSVFRHS